MDTKKSRFIVIGALLLPAMLAQGQGYQQVVTTGNDFEAIGVPQGWRSDEDTWSMNLPFEFEFFGQTYTRICVSSNGYVDLDGACGPPNFLNSDQKLIDNPRIAPLWDDLSTDGLAQLDEDIYVDSSSERVVIRWAGETASAAVVNFAVVLWANGVIDFRYGTGNSNVSPTIGISAGDGSNYVLADYNGRQDLRQANTIRFVPQDIPIRTLTLNVGSNGTVQMIPAGPVYADGQVVTLIASPQQGYTLGAWDGTNDDASTALTNTVTMDADKTVSVTFAAIPYTLDVNVTGGVGSVELDPDQPTYTLGTVVLLRAMPDPCYKVKSWSGTDNDATTANVNSVTINGDVQVTLELEPKSPPAAPSNVSASDGTDADQVTVTWDPVDGADAYQVYRAEDPNGPPEAVSDWISETRFDDADAPTGVVYYWVKARDACSESDFSDPDSGYLFGDAFESDDNPTIASLIALGGTQKHTLMPDGDVDWIRFVLSNDSRVVIQASRDVDGVEMRLYNEDLDENAFVNFFSRLELNLPAGTYYIRVQAAEGGPSMGINDIYVVSVTASELTAPPIGWSDIPPRGDLQEPNQVDGGTDQDGGGECLLGGVPLIVLIFFASLALIKHD